MGLASKLAAAQAAQAQQGGFAPPSGPPPPNYAPPAGAPPGYAAPPGPPPQLNEAELLESLRKCVVEQKIQAFYPNPAVLQGIVRQVVQSNVLQQIAARLNLPVTIVADLIKVALFDVVLLCDNSRSMTHFEEGRRVDELKQFLDAVVSVCSLLDDDGIQIRWFNSPKQADGIRSPEEAKRLVDEVGFQSGSAIGTNLDEKILQPLLIGPARNKTLKKPLLVIVITDGAPYGEKGVTVQKQKLPQVIVNAKNVLNKTPYGADAVSYQFAQVGNDKEAHQFLEDLDEDPQVGSLIDNTLGFEFESSKFAKEGLQLSRSMWFLKLILGPIDDSWDSQGEAAPGSRKPTAQARPPPPPEKKGGFFKKLMK